MRLRLLSRSPLTYWVAVGALAVVTTLAISQLLGRARIEAARYGSPRSVLVATRDLTAGSAVPTNQSRCTSERAGSRSTVAAPRCLIAESRES